MISDQEMTGPHAGQDAVLKRIQDQDGIISLMQAQIEFQAELISKHDKIFEELLSKVQDLAAKVKTLEEGQSKGKESTEFEVATTALWGSKASGSVDSKTSLADMVKEAAEQTLGTESGFVFDEKLGLYFDQSSGYYYDPVKQLYYNGHTKTFYSYDASTNTYQVHSSNSVKRKKKSKLKKLVKHTNINKEGVGDDPEVVSQPIHNENEDTEIVDNCIGDESKTSSPSKPPSDMEEGEISSSAPTSAESSPASRSNGSESYEENSDEENPGVQSNYPPCIRAVVQESTSSPGFKKGTLFVVPFTGGTIGSSGSHHVILLPSSLVEKNHAKIHYEQVEKEDGTVEANPQDGKYFITDLGSQEGTYLNRARLSESGVISEPQEIVHGSTLQIGDIVLLIHIHPGDFTCGHCEPGLILQKEPLYEYTSNTAESVRRSEIKKIKKKYGLDRKTANASINVPETKYNDRAKNRRVKVGSDNPFAKTEVASTNTPIRESNKGFKMLQKMGWKGEGLGKSDNTGIIEPIKCEVKTDRLGLGSDSQDPSLASPVAAFSGKPKSSKQQIRLERLAKTVERFNEATSPK